MSLAFASIVVLTRVGRRRLTQRSLTSPGFLRDVALTLASSRRVLISGGRRCRTAVDCSFCFAGGGFGDMVHESWLPRTGWLGPVGAPAESALLRVMVGGVSQREPVYCDAPRGLAGFGARYTVLIHGGRP